MREVLLSQPRTQRSGVSGRPKKPLTPLRCIAIR
jgi:hypothetical protein